MLDGVIAAPVAVKRSPFNNADVCVRVLFARFRGLSNIGDSEGEGLVVDIRYNYEDLPALACNVGDVILNEVAADVEISPLNNEGRRL